jgi:serine/threonine protein kinase
VSNAPTSIGRYEVLGSIGRGGMGSLFLALDPLLDRQIAVKLLRDDDDELRERFAREARAAARLRHPNIVTIFDVGEHEGQPFIAMEYIQGQTLAEVVRGNVALPIARKLELIEALCDGLGFAHRSGIIHRDIKPANLMIDADGSLKILDFGIARAAESSGMTQAGMLIGTLNYMSPEQVSGQPVDARSDLFAVGAVFYELIAYRQAFPGGLMAGVLNKILSGQPEPLPSIVPDLDPQIVEIIDRALQKEPDRRYPDLAAMRQDVSTVRARLTLAGQSHETVIMPPSTGRGARQTPSTSGRRSTDLSELAKRRAEQVGKYVEAASSKLAEGQFEAAISEAEQALLLDAAHGPAHDVIEKARAGIEARQLEQALDAAAGGLSSGDLEAAGQHLARAAEINPDAPRIASLRKSLNQAIEREEERRQREALEARVRETIDEADRQFASGRQEEAIALLAAFRPTHPLVAQALERKRSEFERVAEARRAEAEQAARAEAEARERDEAARIKAERERIEREKREQADREKAAKAERERREKADREKAERERRDREKTEQEETRRNEEAAKHAAATAPIAAKPDDATIVIPRDRPGAAIPSTPAPGAVPSRTPAKSGPKESARPAVEAKPAQAAPSRPAAALDVSAPGAARTSAPTFLAGLSPAVRIGGAASAVVILVIAAVLMFGGDDAPEAPVEQVAQFEEPASAPSGEGDVASPEIGEGEAVAPTPENESAPPPPPATNPDSTPTPPPAPPASSRPAANANAARATSGRRLLPARCVRTPSGGPPRPVRRPPLSEPLRLGT